MNFLNIVIQGYCNENNREYLVDYFISEFKKAEKDSFCSTDLFFGGCFKIIEEFNKNLKDQIHKQQRELNQYLKSVGANKDEKFVNHFNEQIEYEKLNGNTNFRLENGTMLRLTQKQITDIEMAISFANSMLNSVQSQPIKTKSEILKEKLYQYGFFELEKVKVLSEESKVSLIELMAESSLPYQIAMFHYLGFLENLEMQYFETGNKLFEGIATIINSQARSIKGNISVLKLYSKEDRSRYTADKHKETVIIDYEQLK
jgi:hypothetical protein